MFEVLKKLIGAPEISDDSNSAGFNYKQYQIATCALFIEMASADENFTNEEKDKIISILESLFDLNEEEVNELMNLAEERIKGSISLYEFTKIINDNYSKDQKFELVKNLWRLIYIDKTLNAYEDNFIKKIGLMLNLEHQDIIAGKLLVKEELNL